MNLASITASITTYLEPVLPLDPISDFVIVMLIMLLVPRLFERIGLPGLVGLILGGLLLGPKVLGVISPDKHVMIFLADIGKLMIMFFAGLEIDFKGFTRKAHKSLIYGGATFLFPLTGGIIAARLFGNGWNASVLIGSLLASHTLLSLPILMRYKLMRTKAVTVTIGATIVTDIAALTVLSACVAIHTVGFSPVTLSIRFIGMLIYLPLILFIGKKFAGFCVRHFHDSEDSKTIAMLLIMILAAIGAELIHLEGIVGAFIGGLAVGEIVRKSKVREKLDTLGNVLFIPAFFLIVGSLIDPQSFLRLTPVRIGFMVVIVGVLILTKYLAARTAAMILHYNRNEMLNMWSMSIPQVAATLAAALVAFESVNKDGVRLINESVFDTILILVAVTSILGLILTERFAKRLSRVKR
ncbi:MAG: cation:proton antiporter [Phycisphaerae bacterium]|nr:cation:proton antiporter [Phycisphaerae bacterium]